MNKKLVLALAISFSLGNAFSQDKVPDSLYLAKNEEYQGLELIKNSLASRLLVLKAKNTNDSLAIARAKDSVEIYKKLTSEYNSKTKGSGDTVKKLNTAIKAAGQKQRDLNLNIESITKEITKLSLDAQRSGASQKTRDSLKKAILEQRSIKAKLLTDIAEATRLKNANKLNASRYAPEFERYAVMKVAIFKQKVNILFQKEYRPDELARLQAEGEAMIKSNNYNQDQKDKIAAYVNSLKGYCGILNEVNATISESNTLIARTKRADAIKKLSDEAKNYDKIFGYIISELNRLAEFAKTQNDLINASGIKKYACK